jgi:hypothetical protein
MRPSLCSILDMNFRECPKSEVRRIPLPRTRVNKNKKKERSLEISFGPLCPYQLDGVRHCLRRAFLP